MSKKTEEAPKEPLKETPKEEKVEKTGKPEIQDRKRQNYKATPNMRTLRTRLFYG
jgi:hypothetical protein